MKDLLEWLTGCGPASPKAAVSRWKGKTPRLASSGVFGLCWILKEQVLRPAKECLSSRIGELASESQGKQAKKQTLPPSLSFPGGCLKKAWPTLEVGLPASTIQSGEVPHRCAQLLELIHLLFHLGRLRHSGVVVNTVKLRLHQVVCL